ncbi:hypothetical protein ACFQZJ_13740 [Maribacter chungangensis]|uniref:Lipoprotein n=1 Tax=Maribacter chungangensis TaxID=1069117 RepID=A0ABW3B760_9FLAO
MKERIKVGFLMLRLVLPLFCMSLGLFTSCKTKKNSFNEQTAASNMVLILQDDHSGATAEELLIIKNQKSLQTFFAKINKTRKPGLPLPEIDFKSNMLLVWCAGETTEARPGLIFLKETPESYTVSKVIPKKKSKNKAVTSPFLIYRLPLSDKKIIIE